MTPGEPLVLAVDTSTLTQSVALISGRTLLAQQHLKLPRGHASTLLSVIDQLLSATGHKLEDLDALGVGLGPGSFTGLRIGLSLMKGLSLSTGIPLYGASSLAAMAFGFRFTEALIAPCLDARKGEIYTALYRAKLDEEETPLEPMCEEMVLPPRQLAEELLFVAHADSPILFTGTGVGVYQQTLADAFGARARFSDADAWTPSAIYLAQQASQKLQRGETYDLATLEPRYLRLSEAELSEQRREKEQREQASEGK